LAFACNVRFDALIISAEIGYEKPSREIFEAALSMFLYVTGIVSYLENSLEVDNEHEKLDFSICIYSYTHIYHLVSVF